MPTSGANATRSLVSSQLCCCPVGQGVHPAHDRSHAGCDFVKTLAMRRPAAGDGDIKVQHRQPIAQQDTAAYVQLEFGTDNLIGDLRL